jgi:hypothetical protein
MRCKRDDLFYMAAFVVPDFDAIGEVVVLSGQASKRGTNGECQIRFCVFTFIQSAGHKDASAPTAGWPLLFTGG